MFIALASLGPRDATAAEAAPLASDPALEAQVMQIAEELRCLVCQNETLAASQAELAVDLRRQIRAQLQQGRSAAQIVDFMVERYGAFVRYRPAFDASTALLWIGPFALLLIGASLLGKSLMRRPAQRPLELDVDEQRRLDALLAADESLRAPPAHRGRVEAAIPEAAR